MHAHAVHLLSIRVASTDHSVDKMATEFLPPLRRLAQPLQLLVTRFSGIFGSGLVGLLVLCFVGWLVRCFVGSLVRWLFRYFIESAFRLLARWPKGRWFVGALSRRCVGSSSHWLVGSFCAG